MSSNIDKRFNQLGVSIAEYALIGSLVLLISIPIVMNISRDFNNTLQALKNNMHSHSRAALLAHRPPPSQTLSSDGNRRPVNNYAGPVVDGQDILPPPQPGEIQVCMDGGFCLNIPQISDNPTMTVGANGNDFVTAYATTLDQIVRQLEATPGVDDDLKQLVTQLANKGHAVAAIENTAKTAAVGNMSQFNNMSDGQSQFMSAKAQLDAYLRTHPDELPDALKTMINSGSGNIDMIAATVMDRLNPPVTAPCYSESCPSYQSFTPTVSVSDRLTEIASNGICGSGSEAASCTHNLYGRDPATVRAPSTGPLTFFDGNNCIECNINPSTQESYVRYLNSNKATPAYIYIPRPTDGGGGGSGE